MSTLANEGIVRPQLDRCHTFCGTNSWGPARDDKNSGQIYMMKMGGANWRNTWAHKENKILVGRTKFSPPLAFLHQEQLCISARLLVVSRETNPF